MEGIFIDTKQQVKQHILMARGNKNPPSNGKFGTDRALASRAGKKSKPPSKGLTELRRIKLNQFEEIVYRYEDHSLKMLKILASDESLSGKEHMVLAVMIKAIESGDHSRLDFFLNRTIGKVKDKLEVSSGMSHKTIVEQIEEDE